MLDEIISQEKINRKYILFTLTNGFCLKMQKYENSLRSEKYPLGERSQRGNARSREPPWENCPVGELSGSCGFEPHCSHLNFSSYIAFVSSKEFIDVRVAIGCVSTLKTVRERIKTYIQMHHIRSTQNTAQSLSQFCQMLECSFTI